MESDYKKPKPKMSLELDQGKPQEKKSLWQKIKEFFAQEPEEQGAEYWRNRDPSDW